MNNWDDLKFCLALCRHRTMTAAATVLETNVGTVSRRIQRLTEDVGETLFIKQGATWQATPAAVRLATLAEQTEVELERSFQASRGGAAADMRLRICAPLQLLQCGFATGVSDDLANYPDLRVQLLSGKQSLALNEADIRLSFEEPAEGRLIRRRLATLDCVPCCARGQQDKLTGWVKILYTDFECATTQRVREIIGKEARIEIEGLNLARKVLHQGAYVALLPRPYLDAHPDLVAAPIRADGGCLDIWMSYHAARRLDPAIRIGIEMIEHWVEGLRPVIPLAAAGA